MKLERSVSTFSKEDKSNLQDLGGHEAYALFRSFFEMLNFEGLQPPTDAADGNNGGAGAAIGESRGGAAA
jgi:hypothetical protein